jgi:ribose transport system permease protein
VGKSAMQKIKKIFEIKEIGVFLILIVLIVFLSIATDTFFTASNIFDVLLNSSFIAIMACGMTMVIITSGIDLSVGSVMGFVGMFMAIMMVDYSLPPIIAILLGLAMGTLFGFINGLLVTRAKLPPFITTLGMMSVGRGLAYVMSGGWPISGFPDSFMVSGQGHFLGIPLPVIYLLIVAIIAHVFLKYTVLGKHIYAVGGNEKAAKLVGIKAEKVILITYVINGFLAAVSGFLMTSWLGMAQPNAGQGYELDVIAATVIGGTSLSGGDGSILGAILGAWIMATLRNGMILLRVSSFWQEIVIGVVIVVAVALDKMRSRGEE